MAESKSSVKDEPKGREPAQVVVNLRDDNDQSVADVTSLAVRLGGTVTGHAKGALTVTCPLGADRDEGNSARLHLVEGLNADPLVTSVEAK